MSLLEIGKVTTTHGIKGEIKILSKLNDIQKQEVFKCGSHLVIDHTAYEIKSHRVHKGLDMVCFFEFDNINDVLFMKNKKVYKDETELEICEENILDAKLVTFDVLTTDGKIGKIKSVEETGTNYKILRLMIEGNEVLVPYHKDFVRIDIQQKRITVKLI